MGSWVMVGRDFNMPGSHTQEVLRRLGRGVLLATPLIALAVLASAAGSSAASIPGPTTISAGETHSCGVQSDGTVLCWGDNASGKATPPATGKFTQVSAGGSHTCALTTGETVVCWGDNSAGQAPPAITGNFSQVSSGGTHTCAVRTDGTVLCWGDNSSRQAAPPPTDTFSQISAGGIHTCGVKSDGSLECWGSIVAPPGGTFSQVSAGLFHACAVRSDGTVLCWGDNFFGQSAPPDGTFTQVSAGDSHTCGIRTDGSISCWGYNFSGQATPPSGTYSQVSAGGSHTCAVKTDGSVTCWGDNSLGQATPPGGNFTLVTDTTPPALAVPSNIAAAATGPSGAVVGYAVTVTDPDDTATFSCAPASGSTFPVGVTTVTCTATDTHGNTSNASFTVTVTDNTAPAITGTADITAAATGPEGAAVTYNVNATDPDDSATVSCTPASGSTFQVGVTPVACTATDTHGNTSNASFNVTVTDNTPPVITVPAGITAAATGPGGAIVTYDVSATDPDDAATVTCAPASGSTFPVGATTVACAATDTHGNTANASFTVTVTDTTPPAITVPASITAAATGPSGAVVTYGVSVTDPDDAAAFSCAPASGSTFPVGVTTVACTATDTHGNTAIASFTVTVTDTTPPALSLPANITAEATGPNGAVVTYVASVSDPDDAATFSCTPASGSTFALGLTTVACAAADTHGNTSNASFTVTVRDTTPPQVTINVPGPVAATGLDGATVVYTAAATDVVSGSLTPSCAPPSGSTFPLGSTTVTCTATDGAGNTGSATAFVVVQDKTAPTLNLPSNITVAATSASGAVVNYSVTATDTDNHQSDLTVSCKPPSGSTFAPGSTTVSCTATDPAGNAVSGSFTVTVVDFSLAAISPITVQVGGTGSASVTVNSGDGFSSPVALTASGGRAGVSLTLTASSVTPPAGGAASSTLSVGLSPLVTPTTFTVTITGTSGGVSHSTTVSVTVVASSSGMVAVIGQEFAAGCLNSQGVENALTAKVSAAQAASTAGNTKTAINTLSALINQTEAQRGKHFQPSCTVGGLTLDPAAVLIADARTLINSLAVSATPNPITGSVLTADGLGISGATVTLQDSTGTTLGTATTDVTGFYFFATTGVLTPGETYTVTLSIPAGLTAASPASQTFTWSGSGELSLAGFTAA